jgi:HSP20 family protein
MSTAVTEKKEEMESKATPMSRDPLQALGFPSLTRMRKEFDEMLSKFFTDVPALWSAERADGRWAFDVEDQPDAYVVKAEAPGFEPKDFSIDLRGNQLVLQAKRSESKKEKGQESFMANEFYHAMTIPAHVDTDHIAATYKQGVLQVSLPKTEEGKGRRIPVKG